MSISLPNGTLLATPASQTSYTAAVTRILHLSNFNRELKTRDLQIMFKDYEIDKGGFRIKWLDDVNALVVFVDAGVAKRAYLSFLLSPPPAFSPPASISPYDRPDAAQIIQTLTARAMGHRASMSSFNQTAPLASGTAGVSGLEGLPNSHHRSGSVSGLGSGAGGSKTSGSGWTFPASNSRSSISIPSSSAPGHGGNGSISLSGSAPSQSTILGGIGSGASTNAGVGAGGAAARHNRTGSASSFSLSRQPLAGLGGALNFAQPSSKSSRLPTHNESLDSPALPAGFSTTKGEGVGGGQSRRLTGRQIGAFGTGQVGSIGSTGLGLGVTRSMSGTSSTSLDRGSNRSGESSDTEPIVVMDHAPTPELGQGQDGRGRGGDGREIRDGRDGRGKVPFGQWKMPSSTSPSGSSGQSASGLTPNAGATGSRRDSHSADKAMREVQKALASVEARG